MVLSYPGQDPPPPIVEEVHHVPGDGTGTERNEGHQPGAYRQVHVSSPGEGQAHFPDGLQNAVGMQEEGRGKEPSDLGPLEIGYAPRAVRGLQSGGGGDARNDQGTGGAYQDGSGEETEEVGAAAAERGGLQDQEAVDARGTENEADPAVHDATRNGAPERAAVDTQEGSRLPGSALETVPYVASSGVESLRAAYERQVSR